MPKIAILDSIKCPGCGDVIPISEAIYHQLAERASAAQVSSLDEAPERRAKHAPSLPKQPSKSQNEAN
jgi:hypothetical protein